MDSVLIVILVTFRRNTWRCLLFVVRGEDKGGGGGGGGLGGQRTWTRTVGSTRRHVKAVVFDTFRQFC